MRIDTLLALSLIIIVLSGCNSGSNEDQDQEHEALLNSQRAPLDKAHEVEIMMQDHQDQLNQQIDDQTR
jgi:hypothetical protein